MIEIRGEENVEGRGDGEKRNYTIVKTETDKKTDRMGEIRKERTEK